MNSSFNLPTELMNILKRWVAACEEMPQFLQEIIGVNPEDEGQFHAYLVPLFSRNYAVINFYLSNVVFPREAKQFPKRLAASAWDLAEEKNHVVTGFSGTNDNRDLLPISIEQCDPLEQLGTNAKVLSYLLRPENDHYVALFGEGHSIGSQDILEQLVSQNPPVRVLLDVGAQMLDMQSTEIVSTWLSLSEDIEAIVFFDDQDKLMIMSRDGVIESFESSQFSQKLDVCAVYLDDTHTRGTDLNLPKHFRAAVTLGPHLNKDRLVQGRPLEYYYLLDLLKLSISSLGCMRMRKLGHGQSLVFFAPQEVDRAIRILAGSNFRLYVRPLDIVRWVMTETCNYVQHHLAHWAQQGVEYQRRHDAWKIYSSNVTAENAIQTLRSSWEERDARTLEEMYEFESQDNVDHPAFRIPALKQRLQNLGIFSVGNSKIDEEQEREVSHEVERERQVQRPPKVTPFEHHVHDDVRFLVKRGKIIDHSPAFIPLFSPLKHLGDHEWSSNLLATKDFSTVTVGPYESVNDYQRPLQWILSVEQNGNILLIAISPYEANELLPLIRQSKYVHLHIYIPRVAKAMATLEDLTFFCIPPLPRTWRPASVTDITQLNLFSGQLYLKDYDTYLHLLLVLGLVGEEAKEAKTRWWESDGFVQPANRRRRMQSLCKLTSSPLPFLRELISLRRKGMGYQSTHIGKILHGGLLTREDFVTIFPPFL